jgi:uncharacterized protein YkwD
MKLVSAIVIFISFWMICTTYTVNQYYNSDEIAKDTFGLINSERVSQGKLPLIWDENMAKQAKEYSFHMDTIDELVHSNMGYGGKYCDGWS